MDRGPAWTKLGVIEFDSFTVRHADVHREEPDPDFDLYNHECLANISSQKVLLVMVMMTMMKVVMMTMMMMLLQEPCSVQHSRSEQEAK